MTQKIIYLVERYEMLLDANTRGLSVFAERAFADENQANAFCLKQDPGGERFRILLPLWVWG